jgi:ABC-type nitrate/sulfonate/bicarbonate transport system substrate-binding protein
MKADRKLRIGFIPLVDAASLLVAVDKGFAAEEGLDVELVQEVSWSNIRDRLSIGQYQAAHLLAPMALAATLGLRQMKRPTIAALNLAMNGNAITISPKLYERLASVAQGDLSDPSVSARALKTVINLRENRGEEPFTFGMTFPFSTHNYQLRFWMAEGGINPDRDVRLIVLPPPYMVENLAKGQVDGFCVGAPWNTVAEIHGVGIVLHPGCAIFNPAPEKTLAISAELAGSEPETVVGLIRACLKAANFIASPENRAEAVAMLSRPDRVGAGAEALQRTFEGRVGSAGVTKDYLVFGDAASGKPDPVDAAWLYAQMVRWGQAPFSMEALQTAPSVYEDTFFERASGGSVTEKTSTIGAFSGVEFNAFELEAYLRSFPVGSGA